LGKTCSGKWYNQNSSRHYNFQVFIILLFKNKNMKHAVKTLYLAMALLISNFTFGQTQLEDNENANNNYLKAKLPFTTKF
jgi:uncharacterized membrane protein